MQRAVHERLVFELLGIRERFSNSNTRKALDAYQNHRPQPQGSQDKAPMHKAPLRCASHPTINCAAPSPTWNGRGQISGEHRQLRHNALAVGHEGERQKPSRGGLTRSVVAWRVRGSTCNVE